MQNPTSELYFQIEMPLLFTSSRLMRVEVINICICWEQQALFFLLLPSIKSQQLSSQSFHTADWVFISAACFQSSLSTVIRHAVCHKAQNSTWCLQTWAGIRQEVPAEVHSSKVCNLLIFSRFHVPCTGHTHGLFFWKVHQHLYSKAKRWFGMLSYFLQYHFVL